MTVLRMASQSVETLKWISEDQIRSFAAQEALPAFIYSEEILRGQIKEAWTLPVNDGYGFQLRFAMKANPNKAVLKIMLEMGVHIDAGSEYEVLRAMAAGFRPDQIQLTAQQMPRNFEALIEKGVQFTACSLHQLEEFGKKFHGKAVAVRFNPGIGSGGCTKTDVAGPQSAFGIWHEKMDLVEKLVAKYNIKVTTVHTHIGSGSDPEIWKEACGLTLALAAHFPECATINLGGGFKVERMMDETSTNLQTVGLPIKEQFAEFFQKYGRKLALEVEPGSFYTVSMGILIAQVDDIIDTGASGYNFLKVNTGMDAVTRPALYGSKHPIIIVPASPRILADPISYIVAGHCCESGDLFTQHMGGAVQPRLLSPAHIGDYAAITGVGAYCSSMCCKNYNSYPELAEYLFQNDGTFKLIRKAQTLEQIIQNEL